MNLRVRRNVAACVISLAALPLVGAACGGSSQAELTEVPTTPPVLTTLRPELTTTTIAQRVQRQFYTVQPGDTLGIIAQSFGVSVEAIMEENAMDDTVLTIGNQLLIPPPTTAPAETTASDG